VNDLRSLSSWQGDFKKNTKFSRATLRQISMPGAVHAGLTQDSLQFRASMLESLKTMMKVSEEDFGRFRGLDPTV
jgi:hypothetical protein